MAATATQQILNNGPRNLVLKYTIAGTTGDTAAGALVDVSALDADLGPQGLRLDKAQWSLTGFSCKLAWDAATDVDLIELHDGEGEYDFSEFGGVTSNAGTGASGDVMFTTTGYLAGGNGGSFILHFKKRRRPTFVTSTQTINGTVGALSLAGIAPTIVVA